MSLNNSKETELQRNARWLLRHTVLIVAFTTFSGLLSGCLACFGACDALPSVTKMVVFKGNDGAVYFDIPARKKYRRAELVGIYIYKIDLGHPIPYWSMSQKSYTDRGKLASEEQDLAWPLRYGQMGPLTEVNSEPKEFENGRYRAEGTVRLYDEKGKEFFDFSDLFLYENGAVYDYPTE
ncbi:hypothetical protein [Methylomonas sp. Kb3]|uniref:hypothetical protein n=2 Tax=unclassified Methylomonas TaxID=2608980 RepID=UPI0010568410|nr:hypothetical protein [Methylomonas sp. Kb3]